VEKANFIMTVFKLSVFVIATLAITRCSAITVSLPSDPSKGIKLNPGLVGFSIELDRWPDWTGTLGSPNKYTQTLLENIAARAGVPPPIRIGGNTEDNANFDPQLKYVNDTFPPKTAIKPWPEASKISIGRDFYLLSGNLPAGTDFTWGLNLKQKNVTNAVAEAQRLMQSFKQLNHVKLSLIEIGNEPDAYFKTAQAYTDE
jgi:hypothetical protein